VAIFANGWRPKVQRKGTAMHHADVKKPTGNANSTAGYADKADFATTVHRVKLALPTTDATLAPWLMANAANVANPANVCCTVAGAGYVATLATVATKKRTCTAAPRYGTIHTKPKGPVRRNTQSVEVATPTVKRGFVMPEFLGHGHHDRTRMVYGHGVGYQQCCPHGYGRVSNRHAHPLRVETQPVVLYPVGAKTMQQVNLLARNTAPTKAAPAIIPTTDSASETQAFALLEATSSASLAAFYLRRAT
jgi:hypothetical protein